MIPPPELSAGPKSSKLYSSTTGVNCTPGMDGRPRPPLPATRAFRRVPKGNDFWVARYPYPPTGPRRPQSSPREPLVGRVCGIETHAHRPGESHARKEGRRASTSAAMFEAGEVVEPHIGGLRRRSAQPVCDNERAVELIEFRGVVRVNHQRVSSWPFQDAVPDSRERVPGNRVRHRRERVLEIVVGEILIGKDVGIRKSHADEDPGRPRDVDVHHVEDLAVRFVLVEAVVKEIS